MPKALIFYHFLHPDDVVSAQLNTQLCTDLKDQGWEIVGVPCNRGCHNPETIYPKRESWNGITLRRIWRPGFKQKSKFGRVLNSAWMISAWSLLSLQKKHVPDVLIVGTDPLFSVLVALLWKLRRPKVKIVHWCFDLHPEAAIAEGIINKDSFIVKLLKKFLARAYRNCDLIADIGPCMKALLDEYPNHSKTTTLVPWALAEPETALKVDAEERKAVFGEAKLALMYSGNFGRAHSYKRILELAQCLRKNSGIKIAFSIRGNCEDELKHAVTPEDTNISFVDYAPLDRLEERLSSADIQMVSLQPEWTGTVVPSKFFGALAAGRPVLFSGSRESAIAKWIEEFKVGWVLADDTIDEVLQQLEHLGNHPEELHKLFQHCHKISREQFSRNHITGRWNEELRELLK